VFLLLVLAMVLFAVAAVVGFYHRSLELALVALGLALWVATGVLPNLH
jgi:hypothetical protein